MLTWIPTWIQTLIKFVIEPTAKTDKTLIDQTVTQPRQVEHQSDWASPPRSGTLTTGKHRKPRIDSFSTLQRPYKESNHTVDVPSEPSYPYHADASPEPSYVPNVKNDTNIHICVQANKPQPWPPQVPEVPLVPSSY